MIAHVHAVWIVLTGFASYNVVSRCSPNRWGDSMGTSAGAPLAGVRILEVSLGTSAVGMGLAQSWPGSLLRDFGAEVTRVQYEAPVGLDEGVEWRRPWNRGKRLVSTSREVAARTVRELVSGTDIAFVCGSETEIEGQGLGYEDLAADAPQLIVARIRPSYVSSGRIDDYELLVQARAGLLTQFRSHRPGPAFCDVAVGNAGAAMAAAAGALGILYERAGTGRGGWVQTSLYDGLLGLLGMIIGRAENPSPSLESKWVRDDPTPTLSYRCRDGNYLQLWFGAKGAYDEFLAFMGDRPSTAGYAVDIHSGAVTQRSKRWAALFDEDDRDTWVERLAGRRFRCEPVLAPGECLGDAHVTETGLSEVFRDPDLGDITVLGPTGSVTPVASSATLAAEDEQRGIRPGRLLSGLHVLDLSAYLAGPVTTQVLAELGADVIKVEPATGDAHRGVEFLFAAGQRGKRSIAVDLKSPEGAEILQRLLTWADVVHHNSRIGVDRKLGYDEESVRKVNPGVVYCHASGFGSRGPRATLAANDHLMQALCGQELSVGGMGQGPTYLDWGVIDVTSGWLAACSLLVGLYAARCSGKAQTVTSSLLGAGLSLKSGAFLAGGRAVRGPLVDRHQTGYGAAYRIYEAGDGQWLALVVADQPAWQRLRSALGADNLPESLPPLRTDGATRTSQDDAEKELEQIFAKLPAADAVKLVAEAGVAVELVAEPERERFIARIADDPVNHQLGRLVSFPWGDRGLVEQPAFPARIGPRQRPSGPPHFPALGEHTDTVLQELAYSDHERNQLRRQGVVADAATTAPSSAPVSATTHARPGAYPQQR